MSQQQLFAMRLPRIDPDEVDRKIWKKLSEEKKVAEAEETDAEEGKVQGRESRKCHRPGRRKMQKDLMVKTNQRNFGGGRTV